MIAVALIAFWNLYQLDQHSGLNMNNYQTIMSTDDPLYALNDSNFYLPFKLVSSDGVNILNQNSNKYSKYFIISSYYCNSNYKKY